MNRQVDFEQLLQRIGQRDADAEAALCAHFRPGVFNVLYGRSGDLALSDDLTQRTLQLTLQKARAGQIDEPPALPSFVRSVAVNLLLAHWRKEKRRGTQADTEAVQASESNGRSLLGLAQGDELARIVHEAISSLSVDRDRDAVRRYYLHDEDKGVIVAALGIKDIDALDRLLYRARQRLKQVLLARYRGGAADLLVLWVALLAGTLIVTSVAATSARAAVRGSALTPHSWLHDRTHCEVLAMHTRARAARR